MTDKKQPEALRMALDLEALDLDGIAAELCRLHAENEALHAERERNLNSIRVNNEIINKKLNDSEAFQAGYAAARLEIESLRARGVAPDPRPVVEMCAKALAEELAAWDIDPPLHHVKEAHDACELWLAAIDADRAMRVAQPATAQQPGAATWALPDADRDYMRKVVAVAVAMLFDGYKEDVMRVFSTGELSEFVTITAAMGGERVEDIYRRAWDLLSLPVRASHGQAPAQAAPAAVAGPHVTDAMALAFHSALSDGAIGSDEVEEIKAGLRAALDAAPTTHPAPQPAPASQGDALDAVKQCLEMGESFRALRRVVNLLLAARRNLGPEDHELRDRIDQLLRADAARAAQEGK